jgi:uncharacterized membrane protein YbhN (UPF0104 family)
VLLAGVVWFAGPQRLWRTLHAGSMAWSAAAALVLVPWFLLGILNVWILLRRLTPIAFGTFAEVYAQSWLSSLFLPGQLGDATQVVLLRRQGIPMSLSSAAYATDKVLTLCVMLVVAASGLAVYGLVDTRRPPVGAVLAWAIAAGLLVLLVVGIVSRVLAPRLRWALGNLTQALAVFTREHGLISLNLGLTMLKWMLLVVAYACAFRAFGPPVPLAAVATIPAMSSLVGYIPVSVGGLGTIEWTAVGLFGRVGIPEAIVLSAYLVLRASVTLIAIVLMVGRRIGPITITAPIRERGSTDAGDTQERSKPSGPDVNSEWR